MITAVPLPTAVTTPVLGWTVAMLVLDESHVTVLLLASLGATVAISVDVAPDVVKVMVDGVILTAVTGIFAVTVTGIVVEIVGFETLVTVIVVLPGVMPVNKPVVVTVAIAGSLEIHVIFLFVASAGSTVAFNW